MLEKPNRKRIDKQDGNMPTNFEQLIEKYGLENYWKYTENTIDEVNSISSKVAEIDIEVKDIKAKILEYEVLDTW